jgi:hypothetical protein
MSWLTSMFGGEKDSSSFTGGGGDPSAGGLAPEGIDKGQDSLTQYMRSLTNLAGQQGQQGVTEGRATARTGQNIVTSGLPVMRQALQGLAGPEQYYQSLLGGNKAEMESAVAPETSSILDQYRGKRNQMAKLGPRSGGTGEAVAGSQFGQAADVAKVLQSVRPMAAQGAQQVASARSGIGQGIAGMGAQLGQLGLGESGQGIQQLQQALQGLMQRREQNMGIGSTANKFQQYGSILI